MSGNANKSPITITITELGLSCEASIAQGIHAESSWEMACLAELADLGIAVDDGLCDRLTGLIESHMENPGVRHSVVLIEGKAPMHGDDGKLVIFAKFDPEQNKGLIDTPQPDLDDDEVVDHRERSAFQLIESGEQIGRLRHPTLGVDGVNVFGKPISAKDGKPVVVHADESVTVHEDGVIEAAVSGVVQVDGNRICVLQSLDVPGHVDFTTGHINFPGDVIVGGGVKDQFRVVANRDIVVKRLVEAATLRAGRDLRLEGGAACREKGMLIADRHAEARYLNECDLRIGGDLAVQKEIINSNLVVGGSLLSSKCTLIGGTATITGKCELQEAGSERGTPTRIIVGGKPEAERLDDSARALLQEIAGRIKDAEAVKERLMEQGAAESRVLTDKVLAIDAEVDGYRKLESSLNQAVGGMRAAVETISSVDVLIRKLLWRGTRITTLEWDVVVRESVQGPLRITCEPGEAPILRDLSSGSAVELSTVADVRSRTGDQAADEAVAA